MAWGIAFDFLPLLGSSHQDPWFSAKNGEATLASDLIFFSFTWEREMGDPRARTLLVRDPPFNVGFQGTHLDLPGDTFRSASVLSRPNKRASCQRGWGFWRPRLSLRRIPHFLLQNRLIPLFLPDPLNFLFWCLDSGKYLLFVMKIVSCIYLQSAQLFNIQSLISLGPHGRQQNGFTTWDSGAERRD